MAVPRILLASFETPDVNNLVPSSYVDDYKKLVSLSHALFGGDIPEASWEVHFHLAHLDISAEACNARLIPYLWDKGAYFTCDFTTAGELYVYAHFGSKTTVTAEAEDLLQASMDFPFLDMGVGEVNTQQLALVYPNDSHFIGSLSQSLDPSFLDPEFVQFEGLGQKEVDGQIGSPWALNNLELYPELPADATPEGFLKDKEAAEFDNAKDEFHTTDRDMRSFSSSRRGYIVRARMIASKYGVVARKPCDYCRRLGKSCRILNPRVFTEAWSAVNGTWSKKKMNRSKCACCTSHNHTKCNAE
ncbi:hypothetical protein BU23DRAFT_32103 [Bimuria novae-zelandiae CBS 107.79]|uniref:Uncharacterized protein n=1 Tax=Bimuria novae-zelandiae CBS 107.79 TaxID=1447943 RepID=A0A6A5VJR9_9PLEO|nr:hypothetical protein BU23DRAFT_32103 [Bimuria novae-zelandiae CBS 107.79]